MNIRTQDRQAGLMKGGGILVEGKGKATLLPPRISSPTATALKSCSASSLPHPSPATKEATSQSPVMGHTLLLHFWKVWSRSGLESTVLKSRQDSRVYLTSHPFYLKQKASSVQSVINYFFGFGLMTCARSVENPSFINSWVKMLCALILYVLCSSSVISVMLQLCLEASVCLVCSPYFSLTVCCDSLDNAAFKNMLLRFWDLQVWKWGVASRGWPGLCIWCGNCSKPNILNRPQRTFPRQEEQQWTSLTRILLGAAKEPGENFSCQGEHTGGSACLHHARQWWITYCQEAHWGSWARPTIRTMAGSSAQSQNTGGCKLIKFTGAWGSLQHCSMVLSTQELWSPAGYSQSSHSSQLCKFLCPCLIPLLLPWVCVARFW